MDTSKGFVQSIKARENGSVRANVCTIYKVSYGMYTIECIIHSVSYTMYNIQSTKYNV